MKNYTCSDKGAVRWTCPGCKALVENIDAPCPECKGIWDSKAYEERPDLVALFKKEHPTTDLVYIDRNDEFTDEQLMAYIKGDHDKLYCDFVDQAVSDGAYELKNMFEKENDVNLSRDEEEEIIQHCWDVNESTPLDDLARNTRNKLFSYDLGIEAPGQPMEEDTFESFVLEVVTKFNISNGTEEYLSLRKDLKELVDNAYDGGRLEMLWYGSCDQLNGNENTITFYGGDLAIVDHFNGSGHSVSNELKLTCAFKADNLTLDSLNHYGMDEICGYYLPALEGSVNIYEQRTTS